MSYRFTGLRIKSHNSKIEKKKKLYVKYKDIFKRHICLHSSDRK